MIGSIGDNNGSDRSLVDNEVLFATSDELLSGQQLQIISQLGAHCGEHLSASGVGHGFR
jgi:hypothetical protein